MKKLLIICICLFVIVGSGCQNMTMTKFSITNKQIKEEIQYKTDIPILKIYRQEDSKGNQEALIVTSQKSQYNDKSDWHLWFIDKKGVRLLNYGVDYIMAFGISSSTHKAYFKITGKGQYEGMIYRYFFKIQ